jgi:hypothetical protein
MEPTTDPIAFTREHLQLIATVWIDATKRTIQPYMEKVPAPIAKYLKARTGNGAPVTSDVTG